MCVRWQKTLMVSTERLSVRIKLLHSKGDQRLMHSARKKIGVYRSTHSWLLTARGSQWQHPRLDSDAYARFLYIQPCSVSTWLRRTLMLKKKGFCEGRLQHSSIAPDPGAGIPGEGYQQFT